LGDQDVVDVPEVGKRGMSELIGMVLLISIVLVGAVTVVVLGAGAISDAEEQTRIESAQTHLQHLDGRLATLSVGDEQTRVTFDSGQSLARDYRIDRSGSINVTVNRNGSCAVQQSFSTVLFEDSQGRTVGYEAGGVWAAGIDGSTATSPPQLTFEGGTLDVRLLNLTGQLDQRTNEARLNVTESRNRTRSFSRALTRGDCIRPDNVTIRIDSRFQAGWHSYLESEMGVGSGTVQSFANGTVKAFLPQSALHPASNDRLNQIIDLRQSPIAPFMTNASLDGNQPIGPVVVNASKSVGNNYTTYIEPLTDGRLDIGEEITVDGTNLTGPPLNAGVVLDESGSMWGSKIQNARIGAKNFVGSLNASRDRVAVISYNASAYYRYITVGGEELFFSNDFSAANSSIDSIDAGGLTAIYKGIDYANSLFDLKANQSSRKAAVLLTDGKNTVGLNPDAETVDQAELAGGRGITIYTIGYGSGADESLMKTVANETGGSYCFANNGSAVIACFEEFGDLIKPQNAIAQTPLTSNVTTGSGIFDADIPGNTSHIANVTQGSETFTNLNDPTAPSLFSYSFQHADGEHFEMNVSSYACEPDAWNYTGQTKTVNGSTLSVARCTDIGPVNGSYGADLYVDGQRPTTLLETTYTGWQTDVNQSLDSFPDVDINATTGEFEAPSNHALAVFDLPPEGPVTRNTLALLIRIGLSDQDAGSETVKVRVAEARLRN
jgi:hypothetical protein